MKKANRKLVLRRESLRTLASRDLVHAAGGTDAATVQLQDSESAACKSDACIAMAAKPGG